MDFRIGKLVVLRTRPACSSILSLGDVPLVLQLKVNTAAERTNCLERWFASWREKCSYLYHHRPGSFNQLDRSGRSACNLYIMTCISSIFAFPCRSGGGVRGWFASSFFQNGLVRSSMTQSIIHFVFFSTLLPNHQACEQREWLSSFCIAHTRCPQLLESFS